MENRSRPKVSIIIPIYNMEKYLRECMDSVLNQTLREIEIICVDDGSHDGSMSILNEYAKRDSRIQMIQKDNSGYGNSVNIGIDYSHGMYIGIVEPDDYIKPKMMETLYTLAIKYDLDMISGNYQWFYGDKKKRIFRNCFVFDNERLYNKKINPKNVIEVFKGGFINPAGIFKKDFLKYYHIKHNETPGAAFQDRGFCFLTLAFAKNIMVTKDMFYCYRHDNPNSSIANKKNVNCIIEEYRFLHNVIEKHSDEIGQLMPAFYYKAFASYRYSFTRCLPEQRLNFLQQISIEIKEWEKSSNYSLDYLPSKWREEIAIIKESPKRFLEEFMHLKEEVHSIICTYNEVIIYGVGVIGKRIYDEMYEEDKQKVKGFAVTNCNENLDNYKNIDIKEIDFYLEKKDKIAVIVGVTEKYRDEILHILKKKKFANILVVDCQGMNI